MNRNIKLTVFGLIVLAVSCVLVVNLRNSPKPDINRQPEVESLRVAMERGIIRKATQADYDALLAVLNKDRDIPPVSGVSLPTHPSLETFHLRNAYVIMKPFTFPSDFGKERDEAIAHFILLKGVAYPENVNKRMYVYEMNRGGRCAGYRTGCDLNKGY